MQVELLPGLNVSRETLDKLRAFENLTKQWTKRINLVAPSTVDDMWQRHILDSAQLLTIPTVNGKWMDIGSGGGFPGVVAAVILAERQPETTVCLVESDKRKSVFLKTAIAQLDIDATVLPERIEAISPQSATTISARALASLSDLLVHSEKHLKPDGTALFMKGGRWRYEVEEAEHKWSFDYDVIKSKTEDSAAILKVANIKRKS